MKKIKNTFLLLLISLWLAVPAAGQDFQAAKAQLAQDYTALVKAAGLVAGFDMAAGLVEYAVNRALYTPASFVEMAAKLATPAKAHSKSAKYLIQEKKNLQKEAAALTKVVEMAKERRQALAPKGPFYKREQLSGAKYARLQRENRILEQVFKERYEAFNRHLRIYRAEYREFVRKGKILRIERPAVAKIVRTEAAQAEKQFLRRGARALPLVVLMAWAASSDMSAAQAAMAQRMGERPALLFSLTKEEENKIKNNPVLTQIYIQTTQEIHQMLSLSAQQWQTLAEEAQEEAHAQKQVPLLLQQQLIKSLAK